MAKKTKVVKSKVSVSRKAVAAKPKLVAKQKKADAGKHKKVAKRKKDNSKSMSTSFTRKTITSGEFDNIEFTHVIVGGKQAGLFGFLKPPNAMIKDKAIFVATVNIRKKVLYKPYEIDVDRSLVRELDCYEIVGLSNKINQTAEDDGDTELQKHEQGKWSCNKCHSLVSNENGYCPIIVNGEICMGTKSMPTGGPIGWAGCFGHVKEPVYAAGLVVCVNCSAKNGVGSAVCVACKQNPVEKAAGKPNTLGGAPVVAAVEPSVGSSTGQQTSATFIFGGTPVTIGGVAPSAGS
ncbi:expressed unknown protein [Seminavis robusta]|uniref:Uncharacterized protein n=1 Tax=Seminavis robusta TaxID=568900 RepID=A0A9N8DMQ6_9STRA|nr:expressed unknown protein [Seminavis robusta]|eukprot:Sro168_g074940.1 n/a (292) ;mRNA; f:97820-98799